MERISQLHKRYLDARYAAEYARCVSRKYEDRLGHFDFSINLATAFSGGSGLAVLKYAGIGWFCAMFSAVSLSLAAARKAYGWHDKAKLADHMLVKYNRISDKYFALLDDVNYQKIWASSTARPSIGR